MEHKTKGKKINEESPSIGNVFIVGIDGSEGSHNAVELVSTSFYRPGLDKIILIHISDSSKEHEQGIKYHSKTIYNKYHEYIKELAIKEDDYEIIFEDRKENENVFEQVNEIALEKKGTILVLGFRGLKGSKSRPDELSKSLSYLVHKPKIPVLVIKDKTARQLRPDNQFKWLICLESAESKSFKALKSIINLVDSEKDYIYGLNVDEIGKEENAVRKTFVEEMKKNEIKNYDFDVVPRKDKSQAVTDLILNWIRKKNVEDEQGLDFIVLGYNPFKYAFSKDIPNTTVEVLKTVACNVCFDH